MYSSSLLIEHGSDLGSEVRRKSGNSIQDRFFNHKKIIVSVSSTSDVEFHLTMKEAGEDQERRKMT